MTSKELHHIQRDCFFLVFALGMPVLLLLLFGYGVSFDLERIPLLVLDQQQSRASRALVRDLTASELFVVVAEVEHEDDVEALFRRNVAKAALLIPPDFDRRRLRGESVRAQLLLDGSDNNTASVALGYANNQVLQVARSELDASGQLNWPIELRTRMLYNPSVKSAPFIVPGLMALILVMIAVVLTALTVAREYERGSMEQLFATPVGRLEIILGKLGPYWFIGMLQVLLVLALGVWLFDLPVRGNLLLLGVVATVFMLAMLMQGLFLSVLLRNQVLASQGAILSTLLPALLLSGFVFPIEQMPQFLQILASIFPARYFVHALRAILLKAEGWQGVFPDILAIGAFFLLMLVLASARFRRKLQ
ncbi:MAG: ABC transporter permease [Myxococcota bacterium]|nr:ABC transporter permease [Myxococcota bacterium]